MDSASKIVRGDRRIVVTCNEIEEIVFRSRHDPSKMFGRRENLASRAIGHEDKEWGSVDMIHKEDSLSDQADQSLHPHDLKGGPAIHPPQMESEVKSSIGGKKGSAERHTETPEELEKRQKGQRVAEEREMIRRAARRLVVFGHSAEVDPSDTSRSESEHLNRSRRKLVVDSGDPSNGGQRKCEALMNGAVVEPGFAKGNWAIRWRETS